MSIATRTATIKCRRRGGLSMDCPKSKYSATTLPHALGSQCLRTSAHNVTFEGAEAKRYNIPVGYRCFSVGSSIQGPVQITATISLRLVQLPRVAGRSVSAALLSMLQ